MRIINAFLLIVIIAAFDSTLAFSQSTGGNLERYDLEAPSSIDLTETVSGWGSSSNASPYQLPTTASTYLDNSEVYSGAGWARLALQEDGNVGGEASGGDAGAGGGDGGADPSDPTQVTRHVIIESEWQQLSNNDGDMVALKVSPFLPFKIGQQQWLFNFEVPLQNANITDFGSSTGLGDTRLKLFWLIPTKGREKLKSVVPSFDAIAPTGDFDRALGGGQWILMPNVVFALQPTEKLSVYSFIRYVHSDGLASDLVPDLPVLPEIDPDDVFATSDIRGLNFETMFVFGLENAVMDWIGITPDYFQSLNGNQAGTLTMKYDTGKSVSESLTLLFNFWQPVTSTTGQDFTFKFSLDYYPKSGKGRGRCGRCRLHRNNCMCQ